MTPQAIHAHLTRKYPNPLPSLEWVKLCTSALLEDGQQPTPQTVEEQYLWSDLSASTSASAIPQDLPPTLFPTPTLLQIHSIAEVGASAFSQQSTLEARRDIISGASVIRRMGDEEVEEGRVPPYPRSMLSLQVSDGRSMIRAMEYRRIPELVLGETKLGSKIQVREVRCLKGVLLLEPGNTTVLGGAVEDMDAEQPDMFVAHLNERLEAAKVHKPMGKRALKVSKTTSTRKRPAATTIPKAARQAAPAEKPGAVPSAAEARAARLAAIQAALDAEQAPRADTTFDDDSFDVDDDFFQHIEAVEAAATTTRSQRSQRSQRSLPPPGVEVIEISD